MRSNRTTRHSHTEARRHKAETNDPNLLLCAFAPLCEIPHCLLAVLLCLLICRSAHADDEIETAVIRAAVEKSLPLLQAGAKAFRERSEGRCISCHHQGLVLQTVALARQRGFSVDENLAREEVDRVHGFYLRRHARYLAALSSTDAIAAQRADPFGNFTVHAGYWLWGLAAERQAPDEFLATTVRLLASKQLGDGHWSFTDTARAPMQASDFSTTALAVLALKNYGSREDADASSRRIAAARRWLKNTAPRTTDDKAFRLYGLLWSDAPLELRDEAAQSLLADQRDDGAWAQQDNMPTDAYATGLALVALREAGGLAPTDGAHQRGIAWLLKTQQPDGSWFVKTHAIPTNPYFESGFPHGKSQFISYAATCWATMALLTALPEH